MGQHKQADIKASVPNLEAYLPLASQGGKNVALDPSISSSGRPGPCTLQFASTVIPPRKKYATNSLHPLTKRKTLSSG